MENKVKVIIPAAKIVPSEQQRIGKLPGVVYPINQKIVFDYLKEQYQERGDIDIVCYESIDMVRRRLRNYLSDNIRIVQLPELGDLGHTIYYGIGDYIGTIIINFSDTIVFDNICDVPGDAFYCQEDYMSETWTYFDEIDGHITNIIDKADVAANEKKRLFVGVFKITDGQSFRRCLELAFDRDVQISAFYDALMLYSEKHPMEPVGTDSWFDIGHEDKYYGSSLGVRAREFNHITIDKDRGILRKTSDKKEKFIGEIKWYLKLPGDVEYARPRIFSYSTRYDAPYVSMEYYAYHTVHELYLYGDLTYQQWTAIFDRIRFVCNDFKRYKVSGGSVMSSLEDMYLNKTLQRLGQLKKSEHFREFFHKNITINGNGFISLNGVADTLREAIPRMLYDVDAFPIIHGDLCFSNIMVDNNFSFIKLIDPRGRFGAFDIYGDFRYELAKLFHSVDGKYDYMIKDLFQAEYDTEEPSVAFTIQERARKFDIFNLFRNSFADEIGADLKKIELIEALLFLSMIPLHNESLDQQMVMLGTGLEILNRVVDITVKEGIG